MVLLTGNVPPVKLAQRAWYQKRYRDNWPMLLQARMRVGAPRWWPWSGPAPTSAGPLRATPLSEPRTPRLERPPRPADALDVEESELVPGAPSAGAPWPERGPVATTFGRLALATTAAPAPATREALPLDLEDERDEDAEDLDAPAPVRGSVPPPRPRAGVPLPLPSPRPRPARPAGEGRGPGGTEPGRPRKGNAWDNAGVDQAAP